MKLPRDVSGRYLALALEALGYAMLSWSQDERNHAMRRVKYLYNASGKRTGIFIDLERNRALREDLFDVVLARSRAGERTVAWTTVRRRLEHQGRLKPHPIQWRVRAPQGPRRTRGGEARRSGVDERG